MVHITTAALALAAAALCAGASYKAGSATGVSSGSSQELYTDAMSKKMPTAHLNKRQQSDNTEAQADFGTDDHIHPFTPYSSKVMEEIGGAAAHRFENRAVSEASNSKLLQSFFDYARFSEAAYCPGEAADKVCRSNSCGGIDGALFQKTWAKADYKYKVAAFLATDKENSRVVLSFRGTVLSDMQDVWTDLSICRIKGVFTFQGCKRSPKMISGKELLCKDCLVHNGFYSAFKAFRPSLEEAMKFVRREHREAQLVVTGHSLGGALATLAGSYLRKKGIHADIYTFGSPRVGNKAFASWVSNQSNGKTYRVTNKKDPVTSLPPEVLKYTHVAPEYWFPDGLDRPDSMERCPEVGGCEGKLRSSPSDHGNDNYLGGKANSPCPVKS